MLKVMTIVGTRPELIKMSRVIAEFDKHTNHILVHTGQNFDYELNQIFFDELDIRKPDYFLEAAGASQNAAETIGLVISKTDKLLEKERPDALLIYGDTNSGLAVIAAKKRQIPIFHMEAGNRCFDQRVPEESNRKIIDHTSDINLVLAEHARRYLIAEGFPQERIIKTGSHLKEVLGVLMPQILASKILENLKLKPKNYFLISAHREENVDYPENLDNLLKSIAALFEKYNMPIIISTHPRTRLRLENLGITNENPQVHFLKPFGYLDYIKLQTNAFCILSDSGTITEESSLLDLPAITIRNAHERPEGMDEGVLIMSGLEPKRVLNAVDITIKSRDKHHLKPRTVLDYDVELVSKKILKIVHSYVDYVNRVVWFK